jgi:hypothetical protein
MSLPRSERGARGGASSAKAERVSPRYMAWHMVQSSKLNAVLP